MDCALFQDPAHRRLFRSALLRWYDGQKRDLPWRRTQDPYRIWVSEIMLQQTRVAAVLEHYREFLARFPTIQALATAELDSVLAAWSGLGYYRRARHLHAAAKKVVEELEGEIPQTTEGLRRLPGIGRYTAAAIASIAFGEASAVVDGNVERVLQRVVGGQISMPETWRLAEELVSRRRPGDFNQAMMELGATICTPEQPRCLVCPVHRWCATRGPIAQKRQTARETRDLFQALVVRGSKVKLVRRSRENSVMTGMWELPELDCPPEGTEPLAKVKHSIMNTDYRVRVWAVSEIRRGRWWPIEQLPDIPLTGLARKILRHTGHI